MEPAPEIERVEWLSSSPEAVLVRVHARSMQPRSRDEVRLIVDDGGRRRPFAPDAGLQVDEQTGAWAASFTIPIELRPRLEGNLALEVGGLVLALPGALAGPEGGEPAVDAQVIDRGVLAERRARRAELAEQTLLRRATEAEATVDTLQRQLTNLEQRFTVTTQELERLRRAVRDGEAERRRLRQREYAEQQQRLETEERVRELNAQISGEGDGLRASLRETERKVERLSAELERVQRALAEAQHAAAADEAGLRRARDELAEREASLAEREAAAGDPAVGGGDPRQRVFVRVDSTEERVQELGAQLRSISEHLERREVALEQAVAAEREARGALATERGRHDEELAEMQRRVEDLRGDLLTAIALVRNELAAEHDARLRAESELEGQRATAQRIGEELEGERASAQRIGEELEGERASAQRIGEELEGERATAQRLGEALEGERATTQRIGDELEQLRAGATASVLAPGELPLAHATDAATEAELRRQREEMAEALAAAVARLRARVAELEQGELGAGSASTAIPAAPAPGEAPAQASAAVPWTVEPPAAEASPPAVEPLSPTEPIEVESADPSASEAAAEAPAGAVELPPRLQGVRPKPTEWLASALRRAAVHRDAQLVGELIAELLPAQGLVVGKTRTYGVTIDEVGCYRVATTGMGPASVARIDPPAVRGLDFEIRGSVAQVGALVAGRGSWRLRGLRATPGAGSKARRIARARRTPLTLPELAGANVRVWPGLLLPVLAEAVDPKWTAGERFVVAFAISGATPTVLYVGVTDGAPITVSPRSLDAPPAATLYLSERACLNLLARTPLPAGERVLCAGDLAVAERLVGWMDRAQGQTAPAS